MRQIPVQGLRFITYKLTALVEVKHFILTCVDLNPVFLKVRLFFAFVKSYDLKDGSRLDFESCWFGNGLYLSDAFPEAKRIGLFEWFYRSIGADVDFLLQGPVEPDRALRLRTWNAQTLLELADCDIGVVPTHWQKQQFPDHLSSRLQVIHEGVDVSLLNSLKTNSTSKHEALPKDQNIEVLTYVSRGFEEYRGFPQAMQALALLQKKAP